MWQGKTKVALNSSFLGVSPTPPFLATLKWLIRINALLETTLSALT